MKQKARLILSCLVLLVLCALPGTAQTLEGEVVPPSAPPPPVYRIAVIPFSYTHVSPGEARRVDDLFRATLAGNYLIQNLHGYQYQYSEEGAQLIMAAVKALKTPIDGLAMERIADVARSSNVNLVVLGSLSRDSRYRLKIRFVETALRAELGTMDTETASLAEMLDKLTLLLRNVAANLPLAAEPNILVRTYPDVEYSYTYHYYADLDFMEPIYLDFAAARKPPALQPPAVFDKLGKICLYKNYIFVNDVEKGIHIIDNSDPLKPRKIAFLPLPGNTEVAVKDDILYSNSFIDLVLFDISRLRQWKIPVVKRLENLFPKAAIASAVSDMDMNRMEYRWITPVDIKKGLVIGAKKIFKIKEQRTATGHVYPQGWNDIPQAASGNNSGASGAGLTQGTTGKNGSLTRFLILADYLYIIDTSSLNLYDISVPAHIKPAKKVEIARDIETLFGYENKIFIGGKEGMYIYDNSSPFIPRYLAMYTHVRSYDPVVVSGKFAYVTLRDGVDEFRVPPPTFHGGAMSVPDFPRVFNRLDIVDLSNIANPILSSSIPLNSPYGLAVDGNLLVVCDRNDLVLVNTGTLKVEKIHCEYAPYDVLLQNNLALVVAEHELHLYRYQASESEVGFAIKPAGIIK
jgi:hypothetical protein